MVRRYKTPKNHKSNPKRSRFMPRDIVNAIEAVQAAGLTVYGVEITLAGAINISTQPAPPSVSKRPVLPRQVPEADLADETASKKKLA